MPQQVFGAAAAVSMLNRAFYNTSPSNAVFNNQVQQIGTTEESQILFANQFAAGLANVPAQELVERVLGNMGLLPNDALVEAGVEALEAYGPDMYGAVVLSFAKLLATLENATGEQEIFRDAAVAWNKEVERAYVYSSDPAHTTPQEGDDGSGTTTLTRQTDVLTGSTFTGYLDYNQYTGVDEQTLTTGDRLTGTAGDSDTLFAQQTVGSRPTLNGIEIVSIDAKGVAPTLDLSDSNGIKQVVNFQSSETSTLTFQGLKNLVDVVVDHTNANTVVGFNGSVVAGANDELNLAVMGAGVAAKPSSFTANGIEKLVITASEDASVLGTVTDAQLRTVVIKGDQNLNVGNKVSVAAAQAALTAAQGNLATANTNQAHSTALQTNAAAIVAGVAGLGANPTQIQIANAIAADPSIAAMGVTVASPALQAVATAIFATAPANAAAVQAALPGAIATQAANAAAAVTAATATVATATTALNNAAVSQGFTSAVLDNVDATEATGNIFLNVSNAGATNQTIKTGSGNDTIVVSGLTANDNFDLGGGTNRVVVSDTGSNQAAKLANVQQIEARAAGTNLNLVNAPDVNLIAVAENASINNVTAVKSGTTFAFEGNRQVTNKVFGGVNYNLASATGTDDVINFTFGNGGTQVGTGGTVTIGAIVNTGNNVETLNLNFADVGADDLVTVANLVDTGARTLNVTSDGKVTITNAGGTVAMTGLTSVDASGVKAGFTATFANGLAAEKNATIKLGGSGNNLLSVGKGESTGPAAGASHTLLTVDGSAGTGNQSITITANTDVDANPALPALTNASAYAAHASLHVLGGSGNDTISVTSIANTVNLIQAGAGGDTINLGISLGADVVRFGPGDASSAARDTINGFNAVGSDADRIDLSAFGFDNGLQGVTAAAGALTGAANEFGGNAVYTDTMNNTMYVDVNGDNKLDAADLVIVTTGVNVVVGDILWA